MVICQKRKENKKLKKKIDWKGWIKWRKNKKELRLERVKIDDI